AHVDLLRLVGYVLERLVEHGIDQSQAEERSRAPFCGILGVRGNGFANIVENIAITWNGRDPLALDERSPAISHGVKLPLWSLAKPCFGNRTPAAGLRGVVACDTRCVVEDRTKSILLSLRLLEFLLSSVKLGRLIRI